MKAQKSENLQVLQALAAPPVRVAKGEMGRT